MESGVVDCLGFIGGSKGADALIQQHPRPHRLKVFSQLEGKNLGVVFADADLDAAADQIVLGALSYNGQRCTAIKLVYVHKSVAGAFLDKFKAKVAAKKVGLPWAEGVALTPLPETSKPGYLKELVADAVAKGAAVANASAGSPPSITLARQRASTAGSRTAPPRFRSGAATDVQLSFTAANAGTAASPVPAALACSGSRIASSGGSSRGPGRRGVASGSARRELCRDASNIVERRLSSVAASAAAGVLAVRASALDLRLCPTSVGCSCGCGGGGGWSSTIVSRSGRSCTRLPSSKRTWHRGERRELRRRSGGAG